MKKPDPPFMASRGDEVKLNGVTYTFLEWIFNKSIPMANLANEPTHYARVVNPSDRIEQIDPRGMTKKKKE